MELCHRRHVADVTKLEGILDIVEMTDAIVHLIDVSLIRSNTSFGHPRQAYDGISVQFWIFPPILVEEEQKFLRPSYCKDGKQDSPSQLQRADNRLKKSFLS